jgi:hypothetical protein
MTDEVRLTVIATGFQSRNAVETSTAGTLPSRPGKKPGDYQMSLPISHAAPVPNLAQSRGSFAATAAPPPVPPLARAAAAVLGPVGLQPTVISAHAHSAVPEIVEFADTDVDDYASMSYPAGTMMYTPAPAVGGAHSGPVAIAERMAPAQESRPVIRPAVTSPMNTVPGSGPRRTSGSVPVALAADHLCIEESEFDRPTYLRRAMAGEAPAAMRLPGEGSKL